MIPFPNIEIHSQFIVDFLEELTDELEDENLDALIYKTENLLEIINPEKSADINILKETLVLLKSKSSPL